MDILLAVLLVLASFVFLILLAAILVALIFIDRVTLAFRLINCLTKQRYAKNYRRHNIWFKFF